MIITQLVLNNFGIYAGRHEFDLQPRVVDGVSLPIVLFGGKNGAGKTTILESLRLCLHGRHAIGLRVKKDEYEAYLRRKIHANVDGSTANAASVGLRFEHVHVGVRNTYRATRSWRIEGSNLVERLAITKNDLPFTDISEQHWDDFLRDLIPPGIADLFFFDGEQIQALADENRDSETLQFAVRGLLNLDLVDRLQNDITLYLKNQKKGDKSVTQLQAEQILEKYTFLTEQIAHKRQDRAQLATRHDFVNLQLERHRAALVSEGALFIKNRDEIIDRQREVESQLLVVQDALRNLAGQLLPFAISPHWLERVAQRIGVERQIENAQQNEQNRLQLLAEISRFLTSQDDYVAAIPHNFRVSAAKAIQQRFANTHSPTDKETIRHQFSDADRDRILDWIRSATQIVPTTVSQLMQQLVALEAEQRMLQHAYKQIPADSVGNPLVEAFNESAQELGKIAEKTAVVDAELHQLEVELAGIERERDAVLQKLAELGDNDTRVDRAQKVQAILARYLHEITEQKLQLLESILAEKFNALIRKQSLVREVHIDRTDFRVSLYGVNRQELPKSLLSAGEKQMYATALLWALRSVSGRALPLVIDTPMGRLDSDHRKTLIERFFPMAAHQVIILSTDTEIDTTTYEHMLPSISHTFVLNYDEHLRSTSVHQGYFATKLLGVDEVDE